VKVIFFTAGFVNNSSPISSGCEDEIKFITPRGNPASARTLNTSIAHNGVSQQASIQQYTR
jgi:hypothetical protein